MGESNNSGTIGVDNVTTRHGDTHAGLLDGVYGREAIRAYREREDLTFHHARGSDNFGNLMEGLRLFADYATDMGAITEAKRESLLSEGKVHLSRLMDAQAAYLRDADDVDRFLSLLRAAFNMWRAHLADQSTNGPPHDSSYWGWRNETRRDELGGEYTDEDPRGDRIGWLPTAPSTSTPTPRSRWRNASPMSKDMGSKSRNGPCGNE